MYRSDYSLENVHHEQKKASYNSNDEFNPITKKILRHSNSSLKTINKEERMKRHRIFDESDRGMKTILKEYSTPDRLKEHYEKDVFSSSEPNIQKTSSKIKENFN